MNINDSFFWGVGALFTIIITLFGALLIWSVYTENIIDPLVDSVSGISAMPQTHTNIADIQSEMNVIDFYFDIFVIGLLFVIYLTTLYMASQAAPLPTIRFLLLLIGFNVMLGILLFYTADVLQYFFTNMIIGIFDEPLPLLTKLVANLGAVLFIWYNSILVTNQLTKYIPGGFEQ